MLVSSIFYQTLEYVELNLSFFYWDYYQSHGWQISSKLMTSN